MIEAKKKTFTTFILDETGSMMSIKDDTIGGFNSYIKTLKESGEEYDFTLIKFDSNKHDVVHRAIPIAQVLELDGMSYQPGAATPLVDACVKAIKATETKVTEDVNVAIVILTDGYENASVEYKNEDLVELIKEKTAAGWLILFLGAGIDAFDQAGKIGISQQYALSGSRETVSQACAAAGENVARYAATGKAANAQWSTSQRMSTGGNLPPDPSVRKPVKPVKPVKTETKRKPIVEDIEI